MRLREDVVAIGGRADVGPSASNARRADMPSMPMHVAR
jgi:hypothetical protein